jgi:hypothetical protein
MGVEVADPALAANAVGARGGYAWVRQGVDQRASDVSGELNAWVEEHDDVAGCRLESAVGGVGPSLRRLDGEDSDPLASPAGQAMRHFGVARVVDHQRLEVVGCRVLEDTAQPAVDVVRPTVGQREHGDCPPYRRRLDLVELAAFMGVHNLPAAFAKAFPDEVRRGEVPGLTKGCTLAEELLRLLTVDGGAPTAPSWL